VFSFAAVCVKKIIKIKRYKLLEIEQVTNFKYLVPVESKELTNKLAATPDGFLRVQNHNCPGHHW